MASVWLGTRPMLSAHSLMAAIICCLVMLVIRLVMLFLPNKKATHWVAQIADEPHHFWWGFSFLLA
jgi:hypothetical protein